jgi:hypothetical protein
LAATEVESTVVALSLEVNLVEDTAILVRPLERIESEDVSIGEVHNVKVVADTGAIAEVSSSDAQLTE